jgi:hypothetical protein
LHRQARCCEREYETFHRMFLLSVDRHGAWLQFCFPRLSTHWYCARLPFVSS